MGKTTLLYSVRWCMLLMLMVLPVSVWAQDDSQALVYIEKIDGTVVKVPITPGYPLMQHLYDYDQGVRVSVLTVTYFDQYERSMNIKQSEIMRLYTGFESTGIVSRKAEADHLSEKVYSLNGRYVGNDSKSLEGQPKGVYIVKKGEKYQKVVRP